MAVQASRLPYILATIALILLAGTLLHQSKVVTGSIRETLIKASSSGQTSVIRPQTPDTASSGGNSGNVISGGSSSSGNSLTTTTSNRPSWYDIALSHGTDKVTKHHYHYMYEKYLPAYRDKPLKFLEIGLGCDMSYGPGASYYTWLEYFPHIDLYFIEYDAACVEKWAGHTDGVTIFVGDQGDPEFLESVMGTAGKDFDVIVDDGGHTMTQQIVSLQTLWQAVKPGGVYFCEDLQTSYWADYGGNPGNMPGGGRTMMTMVKELADDLNVGPGGHRRLHEVSADMREVDCMEEICAFVKKARD